MQFNWLDHIFVLFIMVIIPAFSIRTKRLKDMEDFEVPPKKHLFYSNGLMLIIGSLLVLTSWNISERSWQDLGFQWPIINSDLIIPVILIIIIYLSDTLYGLFHKEYRIKKIKELSFLVPLTWKEYSHYIFLAFAAGICEEIIFRGFLVNYLQHFLSDYQYAAIIAITLPAIAFSISHLYQGWWDVLKIFGIALLFGWIFLQTDSLLIIIIIHILIDLISGTVGIGMKEDEKMI